VQELLASHTHSRRSPSRSADAWLAGKLFDDRGSRMSPSEASRGGRRWRYYVSQAILQGRQSEAGSIARVSAPEVEANVAESSAPPSATSSAPTPILGTSSSSLRSDEEGTSSE
jgi:site-specific DNA recombinase